MDSLEKRLRLYLFLALAGVLLAAVLLIVTDGITTTRASSGAHQSVKWSNVVWLPFHFVIAAVLAYRRPSVGAGYAIVVGIGSIILVGAATGVAGVFVIFGWGGHRPTPSELLLFGSAALGLTSAVVLTIASARLALLTSRRERAIYPLFGAALAIIFGLVMGKLFR